MRRGESNGIELGPRRLAWISVTVAAIAAAVIGLVGDSAIAGIVVFCLFSAGSTLGVVFVEQTGNHEPVPRLRDRRRVVATLYLAAVVLVLAGIVLTSATGASSSVGAWFLIAAGGFVVLAVIVVLVSLSGSR